MTSTTDQPTSRFHTAVPHLDALPRGISVLGWAVVVLSVVFAAMAIVDPGGLVDGVGSADAINQIGAMIAGRSLAAALILAVALMSKNTRFIQAAFGMRVLIEVGDVVGGLLADEVPSVTWFAAVLAVVELVAFVYVGAIASGHVARYVK